MIKQTLAVPSASDDKVSEAELHGSLQPSQRRDCVQPSSRSILVTGATGFLGANLLRDLLADTTGNVFCLVRGATEADGMMRIRGALQSQRLWSAAYQRRIRVVIGNLARPRLGISRIAFECLANEIDTIYHAAAYVNLLLPYKALRGTNVCGMQELLRLAMTGPAKQFHYVSSVAALGWPVPDQVSQFTERFRVSRPRSFADGYSESKWDAEQLVNAAYEEGLAASIYRPGLITGHSVTGVSNQRDSFSLMLKACTQLGLAPEIPSCVRLTPVDFVSRSIVDLSQQTSSSGRAFHLIGPNSLSWQGIGQILLECSRIRGIVPFDEWLKHARAVANSMPDSFAAAIAVLPHILDLGSNHEGKEEEESAAGAGSHLVVAPRVSGYEEASKLFKLYVTYLSPVA
jgi:thioester reductase-like protein